MADCNLLDGSPRQKWLSCKAMAIMAFALQVLLSRSRICGDIMDPQLVFQQAMVCLDVWLLQRQALLVQAPTATPAMLMAAVQMLHSALDKAAVLSDDGHDVSAIEAECHVAAKQLRKAAGARALAAGQEQELGTASWPTRVSLPTGVLPDAVHPSAAASSLDAARQRAATNLGNMPLLPATSSFTEALAFLQLPVWKAGSALDSQHRLRSVEALFYHAAAEGFTAQSVRLASLQEVEALQGVVDSYTSVMASFLVSPAAEALLIAELHSRQTLVVRILLPLACSITGGGLMPSIEP